MKVGRFLPKAVFAAFAVAACIGAGTTDASAEIKTDSLQLKLDGNGNGNNSPGLEVKADDKDLEIMVGVAKASIKNNKIKVKVPSWDVYDGNSAFVDLSKLSIIKDNYIALKTDDMELPVYVKINASPKKNSVEYDAANDNIIKFRQTLGNKSSDVILKSDEAVAEYRTASGQWQGLYATSGNFREFQYEGGSLYVRVAGKAIDNVVKSDSEVLYDLNDKTEKTIFDLYDIGSLPGKETKLNIAKQANAPSVSVNYLKGTLTLKANTEYRLLKADANGQFSYYSKESGAAALSSVGPNPLKNKDIVEFFAENEAEGTKGILEVRTAAKNAGTKKSKPASKWKHVEIEIPSGLTGIKTDTTGIVTNGAVVATGSANNAVISAVFEMDNKKTAYKSLVFENKGDVTYEFILGDDNKPAKTEKVKGKLKAGQGKKLSFKKTDIENKTVWIRVAGNKKSKTWAGAYTKLGKVTFPSI